MDTFAVWGWTEDFWKAFLERPKIFRWLCKKFMGRYAWNELIGAKQAIEKSVSLNPDMRYDLKNQNYHQDLDNYKNW